MSRAMFVQGFREAPTDTQEAREAVGVDMSFSKDAGVTDTDDEPDALGCVLVDVANLDPSIKFLRIYCQ